MCEPCLRTLHRRLAAALLRYLPPQRLHVPAQPGGHLGVAHCKLLKLAEGIEEAVTRLFDLLTAHSTQ